MSALPHDYLRLCVCRRWMEELKEMRFVDFGLGLVGSKLLAVVCMHE